jgi:hypothetical protein
MRSLTAVILASLALLSPGGIGAVAQQQQRESAIVNGHRIQPRADEFKGDHPDVPPGQDKEVDSLYQQVLRDSAAPIGSSDVVDPKPAPPNAPPKPR